MKDERLQELIKKFRFSKTDIEYLEVFFKQKEKYISNRTAVNKGDLLMAYSDVLCAMKISLSYEYCNQSEFYEMEDILFGGVG